MTLSNTNRISTRTVISLLFSAALSAGGCAGSTVDADAERWVMVESGSTFLANDEGEPSETVTVPETDPEPSETIDAQIPELDRENPEAHQVEETEEQEAEEQEAEEAEAIDDRCDPTGEARLSVEVSCSWGTCPSEVVVTVLDDDGAVASGSDLESLTVPAGCPLEVRVTLGELADAPTLARSEVIAIEDTEEQLTLELSTGLLRVTATDDGRRVQALAHLYRVNVETDEVEATSCGTMSANGVSHELSAGRYQVVVLDGGRELVELVTIGGGESRALSLDFAG